MYASISSLLRPYTPFGKESRYSTRLRGLPWSRIAPFSRRATSLSPGSSSSLRIIAAGNGVFRLGEIVRSPPFSLFLVCILVKRKLQKEKEVFPKLYHRL